MNQSPSYGERARRQALWNLVAQSLIVGLPGIILTAAGRSGAIPGHALFSAIVWTAPRVLGAAALWGVRKRAVRGTLPTRLLFRAALVACSVPAVTALALLGGWGILALNQDPSALMAIAELDSTLSSVCLGLGFVTFALGFWFGKPR